ncbi:MAG: cation diffusion facilitator family transporter [Mucilaginibacter sp.]|uniref:cation diffusion facilitator family transporter n=1 Tax=Mucilaginibacter sp. TaxID=1882438 RepID=UPI0032667C4B
MGHDHHHDHAVKLENVNTAFIVGIILNFLFVVIEVVVGISIHSLSLLSDAGHNLGDVGALALSLLAFRLLKVKANKDHSYGYRKASILASLFNAMILLISIGVIFYEAVRHIMHPEPLPGLTVSIVAGIGIVINTVTGLMFMKDKEKDINVKAAYLHLMSDAVVSLGIVIAGIIIYFTHFYLIDSILSIVIAGVILVSTWNLLKTSMRLSLDGIPEDIHMAAVEKEFLKVPGVNGVHHIHIWAISTVENAMTAHVVLADNATHDQIAKIKHELKHAMERMKIQHLTLETETESEHCKEVKC